MDEGGGSSAAGAGAGGAAAGGDGGRRCGGGSGGASTRPCGRGRSGSCVTLGPGTAERIVGDAKGPPPSWFVVGSRAKHVSGGAPTAACGRGCESSVLWGGLGGATGGGGIGEGAGGDHARGFASGGGGGAGACTRGLPCRTRWMSWAKSTRLVMRSRPFMRPLPCGGCRESRGRCARRARSSCPG